MQPAHDHHLSYRVIVIDRGSIKNHSPEGDYTSDNEDIDTKFNEEDEDDFDITLQTPYRSHPPSDTQDDGNDEEMSPNDSASTSSYPSRSTTFSTVANQSSLRTRTSSESTNSMLSSSDQSSVLGQKRAYPRGTTVSVKSATSVHTNSSDISDDARNATIKGRPLLDMEYPGLQSSTSETLDDEDSDSSISAITGNGIHDLPSFGVKRMRTADPIKKGTKEMVSRPILNTGARDPRKQMATAKSATARTRGRVAVGPHSRGRSSSRARTRIPPSDLKKRRRGAENVIVRLQAEPNRLLQL